MSVTVSPDSVMLAPGESIPVIVSAEFDTPPGVRSVTVRVEVLAPFDGTIEGRFSGVIPAGEHWHIVGDVTLTGDVFVEGLLTGVDTFHVQGNGFTVFFQNGGRADLHGKFKAPWGPWGTDTTGWVVEDRLVVAATKAGVFVPSELAWSDWSTRPVNSPDVTLIDGTIAKPEVANLAQSIVFENLGRGFHFHDSAGVQQLSDVKFLNCGTTGVLGNYPVHFHLLGDNSRGSLIERVVVEGGKNHAYVPHGSHGITLRDCVAYNTNADAFWWDKPLSKNDTTSNSNDILFDHVLGVGCPGRSMFVLMAGSGNSVVDSVMTGVAPSAKNAAGYVWPEAVNQNVGGVVWNFQRNIAHNNKWDGIFVWQNDISNHVVEDFVGYHNGVNQIDHGAYGNTYKYRRLVLHGGRAAFQLHARSAELDGLVIEDVVANSKLVITAGNSPAQFFVTVRCCQFPSVEYSEQATNDFHKSFIRYEDCGLTPADFQLLEIHPESIIEITEGGVMTHRWAGGWR